MPKSDQLQKPRIKLGSWIDTGRFRPAQVVRIKEEPPHTMTLSYGDEVDEDFRPHIVEWKTVPRPKRVRSLKDEFSEGDWVRHSWHGYGRILAVRNSTLDIEFKGRQGTFVPDAHLTLFEKVDRPEPKDNRPLYLRFPPGTWIEQGAIGKGLVLEAAEDSLTVISVRKKIETICESSGEGPVIWKQDRPPLDLNLPCERRRLWWLRNGFARKGYWPCACCGHPNLGKTDGDDTVPIQCIICGWRNTWCSEEDYEAEDGEEKFMPKDCIDIIVDQEWPNRGYILTEARNNFETEGVMFRRDDPELRKFVEAADLRRRLIRQLDKILAGNEDSSDEDWSVVEQIRDQFVTQNAH